MVDRASDRPAYRQIADVLRERVRTGKLAPGAQVPSFRALAREYEVSEVSARRALEVLVREGLLESLPGKGTFVRQVPPVRRLAGDRYSRRHRQGGKTPFMVDVADRGPARFESTRYEPAPAPDHIAERLHLPEGALVLVQGLRFIAGEAPWQISTAYVPYELVDGTPIADPANRAWERDTVSNLESVGVLVDEVIEEITARMPRPEEVRVLDLPEGVPVLVSERTMLARGRPVETCDIVMPADRYRLSYRIPVD